MRTKTNAELGADAQAVADIVASVTTDQRHILYLTVATLLNDRNQYFTAKCFEVISDIDSGRRRL